MSLLSFEQKVAVLSCLVDGCSINTTVRLTDVSKPSILKLVRAIGEACERLHDRMMVNLKCSLLQFDEQWSFVHTKQGHLKTTDPVDVWGDCWTFVCLAVTQRAIISFRTGKRTLENARPFVKDVRNRVLGRPQASADGWKPYTDAVEEAFGMLVDFGVFVKQYEGDELPEGATRHRVRYKGAIKVKVSGNPNMETVSTSLIERCNLTTRMSIRRFTRKTNGFSKKVENHAAAFALHAANYNFCRIHETLRTTPAMALGITDHVWDIPELLREATKCGPAPTLPPVAAPLPQAPAQMMLPGMGPGLRVIRGGRD